MCQQVRGAPYIIKDHGMDPNGWLTNQGLHGADAYASPLKTPGSGQGGRKVSDSNLGRHSNMELQTPGSIMGKFLLLKLGYLYSTIIFQFGCYFLIFDVIL